MNQDEIIAMAKEAGMDEMGGVRDNGDSATYFEGWPEQLAAFAVLVAEKAAAQEREALLGDGRCGEVPLPMQVAARWPSVPGSHKYAGAGGCAPGSFGADSEDLFTTAQLLDYGDRRAAAAIRARGQKEGV